MTYTVARLHEFFLPSIFETPRETITHLDPVVRSETVELVQQFEHGPLHFTVTRLVTVEPLGPDRVELVDKDDGGLVRLGEFERIPDELGAVTDEHLPPARDRRTGSASTRKSVGLFWGLPPTHLNQ